MRMPPTSECSNEPTLYTGLAEFTKSTLPHSRASSSNSHTRCRSMFRPDALLAERRASSSSRSPNNAGRTRPEKLRASSPSPIPQPRPRQDAPSHPTISHTMGATTSTTHCDYTARRNRSNARNRTECECSKGSRCLLPWPMLLTLYAWNVTSVPCAKASVIPTPAPRTSSHAISVTMSPSARTGAYTYIPQWRRQATGASGSSTDGAVGSGEDDIGSLTSALGSIASFASIEVPASESSTGTDSTPGSPSSESTSSTDSTSSTISQSTSSSTSTSTTETTTTGTTESTSTTSTTSSSTTSETSSSTTTTTTDGSSTTTSSSSTSNTPVTSQTSGTSSSSTSMSTSAPGRIREFERVHSCTHLL
ncbi:hypothetical protein C8Q73DRAFT_420422 [Cubamyces lactineus]|nr:hypothetical protein C8Q73DRAFT_420422 [Cubamyces lactineus]